MDHRLLIPQQNIVDVCTEYAKVAGGNVTEQNGFRTFLSPGFFYTRNVLEGVTKDILPEVTDAIIEGIRNGRPSLTTFTEELAPEGTKEWLEHNGFSVMLTQHGMIFEPGTPIDPTEDPHIARLYADDITRWVDTMMLGFAQEKEREDLVYEYMIQSPDLHFLAYIEDGRILGTTILHLVKGYSGLHEVSVDPAFQRRGIARKLVTHALQIVERTGSGGVTLQASDMGQPVYASLGFQKVSNLHSMLLS